MEGWNRVLIHIYFLRSRLPITSRGWQASFYRGNLSMNGLFFSLNCFQISIKIEEAINDLNESFGIACLRMVKGNAVHHSSWPVITPSPLPRVHETRCIHCDMNALCDHDGCLPLLQNNHWFCCLVFCYLIFLANKTDMFSAQCEVLD